MPKWVLSLDWISVEGIQIILEGVANAGTVKMIQKNRASGRIFLNMKISLLLIVALDFGCTGTELPTITTFTKKVRRDQAPDFVVRVKGVCE